LTIIDVVKSPEKQGTTGFTELIEFIELLKLSVNKADKRNQPGIKVSEKHPKSDLRAECRRF
jgi:hypothetical protein